MANTVPSYAAVKATRAYDALLNAVYLKATPRVGALTLPCVKGAPFPVLHVGPNAGQ